MLRTIEAMLDEGAIRRPVAETWSGVNAVLDYVCETYELPYMARARDVMPHAFLEDRPANEIERAALRAADDEAVAKNREWAVGLVRCATEGITPR